MRSKRRIVCAICGVMVVYLITNLVIYKFSFKISLNEYYYLSGTSAAQRKFPVTKDTNTVGRKSLVTTVRNVTTTSVYHTDMSFNNFSYPLDVDMVKLVQEYRRTGYVKNRVINRFTHRYLHNPVTKCASNGGGFRNYTKDVFVLFVVKSKSRHWQQRNAIRQTWGNEYYLNDINIRTVFVLGTPVNESLNPIWDEIKQFNDIILMDFHDTYFNNTLKTSTSFYWVPEFCPKARFIVLVDDDIYISLKTLVLFLNNLPVDKRIKLYMGRTYDGYQPHRNTTSKWFVPVSEYPWDTYPPFVAAGTVIMTMDFVSDVRTAMPYTKLFRLDDVYLAIIAYKLGVSPVHNTNVYGYRTALGNKFVLASHGFTPEQMKLAWKMHMLRE